jgi:hypothetical protein
MDLSHEVGAADRRGAFLEHAHRSVLGCCLYYYPSYLAICSPLITLCSFHPSTYSMHSWTESKVTKVQFFQQMGEWYVNEKCTPDGTQNVTEHSNAINDSSTAMQRCCAAKPIIKCHFRDKPSIIPCDDSPPEKENSTYSFHPKKK